MKFIGEKYIVVLKWLALIAIPAIGVLYLTLSHIWGLPFGPQIAGTCEAVALCLGVLIGVSKSPPDEDYNPVDYGSDGYEETE